MLRAGTLQQVADPFTLYRRPANLSVAGFIGSPPINVFAGTLDAAGAALEADGLRLPLPPSWRSALGSRAGRALAVGIRPEDLSHLPGAAGMEIPAEVDVREPLGNEVLIYWKSSLGTLCSRSADLHAPAAGERATLHFGWEAVHLFDPENEARIANPGEPS